LVRNLNFQEKVIRYGYIIVVISFFLIIKTFKNMSLYSQSGFVDDKDESLQSKGGSSLKFGLNNATLVKFEFNPNGGKNSAVQDRLDIVFNVQGTEVNCHKFPINGTYAKNPATGNQELVKVEDIQNNGGTTHWAYNSLMEDLTQFNAVITHIMTKFVPLDSWKNVYSQTPIQSFQDLCNRASTLLKSVPNWNTQPLHLMAQYQYSIKGTNTMTYLEIPSNMKQGRWLENATVMQGTFKTSLNEDLMNNENANDSDIALKYINENGVEHSFTRTKWFMASPYANQQRTGNTNAPSPNPTAPTGNPTASPNNSAW